MTADVRVSGLSALTSDAINAAALLAIARHGLDRTPASPGMDDVNRLLALHRQVGEVVNALVADELDRARLERALLNVAAAAGMWIDGLAAAASAPPAPEPAPVDAAGSSPADRRALLLVRTPIDITPKVLATLRAAGDGLLAVPDGERAYPVADPTLAAMVEADLVELTVSTSPLLLDRWEPTEVGREVLGAFAGVADEVVRR